MFEMMLMGLATPGAVIGKQVILSPPGIDQKVPTMGAAYCVDMEETGIYYCLGTDVNSGEVRNLWYYRFSSNTWHDIGQVPDAMVGTYGVLERIGNKLYWVCDELVFSYDLVAKLWTRHKDIVAATLRGYGQISFVWNNELYVYGEARTGTGVYLKKYSPKLDEWYAVSTSPVSRSLYGRGVIVGDMAYFFTSVKENRMVTYNMITKAWRVVVLPWAMRSYPVCTYQNGFIYLSGGAPDGSVWRYEISSDAFLAIPKLNSQRTQSLGGYYNGKMYIWGGLSGSERQRTMLTYQI